MLIFVMSGGEGCSCMVVWQVKRLVLVLMAGQRQRLELLSHGVYVEAASDDIQNTTIIMISILSFLYCPIKLFSTITRSHI
jgi:hypothetical protein